MNTSEFVVTFDRLNENEAPALEFLLGLEGDFYLRLVIGRRDLDKVLAALSLSSRHVTVAQVDHPSWSEFA